MEKLCQETFFPLSKDSIIYGEIHMVVDHPCDNKCHLLNDPSYQKFRKIHNLDVTRRRLKF